MAIVYNGVLTSKMMSKTLLDREIKDNAEMRDAKNARAAGLNGLAARAEELQISISEMEQTEPVDYARIERYKKTLAEIRNTLACSKNI